jgi:hypothetical protein
LGHGHPNELTLPVLVILGLVGATSAALAELFEGLHRGRSTHGLGIHRAPLVLVIRSVVCVHGFLFVNVIVIVVAFLLGLVLEERYRTLEQGCSNQVIDRRVISQSSSSLVVLGRRLGCEV